MAVCHPEPFGSAQDKLREGSRPRSRSFAEFILSRAEGLRMTTLLRMTALLFAIGCAEKPAPVWHQDAGYRWRELRVSGGSPGFSRMDGRRTGVNFENTVSDSVLL